MIVHSILVSLVLVAGWSTGLDVVEVRAAPSPLSLEVTELADEPTPPTGGDRCEADPSQAPDKAASGEASGLAQPGYCYHDCSDCWSRHDCTTPEVPGGFPCTAIQLC